MSDKYKLFNNMKIDDSNYTKHTLSEEDKINILSNVTNQINKQENTKKHKYKKLAIASLLCVCTASVVLSNDTVWAMVENIGHQIEELLGKPQKEYDGFKVNVNQSVTDSNLTVNLTEALLNDGEIILSIGVDSSDFDLSEYKNILYYAPRFDFTSPTIYIDDTKFTQSSGWGGYEVRNGNVQEFIHAYSLTDIDTDGDSIPDISDYEIMDNIDPNKDYEVKIVFDELTLSHMGRVPYVTKDKHKTINGHWEFTFKVNGKNMKGKTQVFDINKEFELQNEKVSGKVLVESLRVSPISARLKYKTIQSDELVKSIDDYDVSNVLGLELFDQDGNNISGGGGGSSNDLITFDSNMNAQFDSYKDLESIKIVPYIYSTKMDPTYPDQHKKILFEDKAIVISLDK